MGIHPASRELQGRTIGFLSISSSEVGPGDHYLVAVEFDVGVR